MDLEIENIDQSKLIPKIDELPIRRFPDQLAQVSGSEIVTQIYKFLKSVVRKKCEIFWNSLKLTAALEPFQHILNGHEDRNL